MSMKKRSMIYNIHFFVSLPALMYSFAAVSGLTTDVTPPPQYVTDQILVAFKPGTPAEVIRSVHAQNGGQVIRTVDAIGMQVVSIKAGTVQEKVATYSRNPNIRYAEPNYLRVMIIPNEGSDPLPPQGLGIDYFKEQYSLNNTGQSFYYDETTGAPGAIIGKVDADIDAPEAWDLITDSSTIKIAVLDSGIDFTHPDLDGKLVENMNFGPSPTTDDVIGHGTLVGGVAAAETDNNIGIAGVSWGAGLGSLKVCYEYPSVSFPLLGLCDSAASAEAMTYAADNGYQVINMSYGGSGPSSTAESDAAAYAWENGVVLVAAAGNGYTISKSYPAALPEVIAVAATDWHDNLASFSNFDPAWVSLAAPGVYTFSTFPQLACPEFDPNGCYGWASGTSFSSPHVAGAAALVWAYQGASATPQSVRNSLENGADTTGAWGQNFLAWTAHGRLNVYGAVTGATSPPPPPQATSVHTGDLQGISINQGATWRADVTVSVHDENEANVSGATVSGTWSGGYTGQGACQTSGGTCVISSGGIAKKNASATFTIDTIIAEGFAYAASSNHDPGGDSNGTSIIVMK